VQEVTGVDGELGLADPGHALDRGDHHGVARPRRAPEPVELAGPAGEPGQVRGQPVLDPDMRRRLGLAADDAQRGP
jgi:hypothetical protein